MPSKVGVSITVNLAEPGKGLVDGELYLMRSLASILVLTPSWLLANRITKDGIAHVPNFLESLNRKIRSARSLRFWSSIVEACCMAKVSTSRINDNLM